MCVSRSIWPQDAKRLFYSCATSRNAQNLKLKKLRHQRIRFFGYSSANNRGIELYDSELEQHHHNCIQVYSSKHDVTRHFLPPVTWPGRRQDGQPSAGIPIRSVRVATNRAGRQQCHHGSLAAHRVSATGPSVNMALVSGRTAYESESSFRKKCLYRNSQIQKPELYIHLQLGGSSSFSGPLPCAERRSTCEGGVSYR